MTARYDQAFGVVLGHEGGFVDHPRDPGGATNHGVSLRYARGKGLLFDVDRDGDVDADDIRLITPDQAKAAFREDFWDPIRGDDLPPALALLAFDAAVNSGAGAATRWLQAAARVRVDGVIGPRTLEAVQRQDVAEAFHAARMEAMGRMGGWPSFGRGWAVRMARLPFQAMRFAEVVG